MTYTSTLLRLLDERGYIHQLTDAEGLDKLANAQVVPGYIGFDATAPSLSRSCCCAACSRPGTSRWC
jgi:tyrosyl-tRNA synthetase